MLLAKLFGSKRRSRRVAAVAARARQRLALESLEQRLALTGTTFNIASITPDAWSVAGGAPMTITLSSTSLRLSGGQGNQTVLFGSTDVQLSGSDVTYVSPTQITLTSPVLAAKLGTTATSLDLAIISSGQQPGTDGSNVFDVQAAEIQGFSSSEGYLSGGQTISIFAPSAAFGFGTVSETIFPRIINFKKGHSNLYMTATWISQTELQVVTPAFPEIGDYEVSVQIQGTDISVPLHTGSNIFKVEGNPTFTKAEYQITDNTGDLPGSAELYVLLQANNTYYTINTDGTLGASNSNGVSPTKLSTIAQKNGKYVISAAQYLDSGRLYFTTSSSMTTQPAAGGHDFYYDYVEPSFSATGLNVDTTQVDQFGMPIMIQVVPNDPAHTSGSGANIAFGVDRSEIITRYKTEMVDRFLPYQDSVKGVGGTPLYQILAPQYVINNQYQAASGVQTQGNSATITPKGGQAGGWLADIKLDSAIAGVVKGSYVSGPNIPAGTYVQTVSSDNLTLEVTNTAGSSNPFTAATVNPASPGDGLNFFPVPTGGFTGLASWFGPTWQSSANLNTGNAIDDFFKFYKTNTFWQEDNGTTNVVLYGGKVRQISLESIDGTTADYAVMQFTGGSSTSSTGAETYNIFYPYFTTNSPVGKKDPFGNDVPPPPAYFRQGNSLQSLPNYVPPSQMIFGASGVFADNIGQGSGVAAILFTGVSDPYAVAPSVTFDPPPSGTGHTAATGKPIMDAGKVVGIELTSPGFGYTSPPAIYFNGQAAPAVSELMMSSVPGAGGANPPTYGTVLSDLERDLAAALIRGYGTTLLATSNTASVDLPTFTATSATEGKWTLTSPADKAMAANIKVGMYLNSFKALNFPMRINSPPQTTAAGVEISATAVNSLPGALSPDNLQFFNLYEEGSVYDAYSAFFQNKGDFASATIDGHLINIDGRAYGDPYSDFMDFSSDISASPATTGGAPANQTAVLQITLGQWGGGETKSSIAFVSGDFDANGLDDVAELTSSGQWRVALTPTSGDPTTSSVGTPWATEGITWEDFTVIRLGDRDVIVARAEGTGVGSWWKLSYDGTTWSNDFVGSWVLGDAWLDFVSGDFDGDGTTDIAGRSQSIGEWWMLANAAETTTTGGYASKNMKIGEWHPGVDWQSVVAGNFDGDASPRDSIAGLAGSTWWQLDYTGSGTFTNSVITTNWSDQTTWSDFVVGNFSGAAHDKEGIAARNASNEWYTVSNTGTPSQQPTYMAKWAAGTWKNIVVGNFSGDASGAVGIAGRRNSTGEWHVVQKDGTGYQSVNYQGAWPTSSIWAQAFAGVYNDQSGSPTKKFGILGRAYGDGTNTWEKALSSGTFFTSSAAPGYPS